VVTVGALPVWPELPDVVRELLSDIEREGDDDPLHFRPWDLAGLPTHLQEPVWAWLEEVVVWVNATYAYAPDNVTPPCWQQHPHLAMDLAVLAFAREFAYRTTVTTYPDRWQDQLAAYWQRMRLALPETFLKDCQRGKHGERPSQYEVDAYNSTRLR
jgi:hypothetical protein